MTIPWVLNHKELGNKPWTVQEEALRRSQDKTHYAYFLEQGLGKTSLAINDFLYYWKQSKVNLMLVICPNSFKLDWKTAPREWNAHITSGMWPKDSAENCWLYAMNYEACRTDAGLKYLKQIFKKRKVFLVLDETSYIKTPNTITTKTIVQISRQATMVRELNGTPQTSSVLDYYAQLKVLNELDGLTSYGFRNRFAIMGGYMGKKPVGQQNEEQLAKILNRCSFRALKSEWRKDLPPRIFKIIPVEMTNKQLKHYEEMKEVFSTMIKGERVTATLVLTQLGKLRQISSCIVLDQENCLHIEEPKNNPKMKTCLDIINGQEGKVIIVYYYKETGRMLKDYLAQKEIKYNIIEGGMQPDYLEGEKYQFNNNSEHRIILCQQNAACMGHTLIGKEGKDRCATMIFFENSFSLRDRLQMLDRNHRGAQDQTCVVYDLVTSQIEKKIIEGLNKNKEAGDMIDELVAELSQSNGKTLEGLDR